MEIMENSEIAEPIVNHSQMSFGSYLKNVRLEKGLSIEDIMDYTRISKFVIQQIEAENRANLPEDVFLKGFLKAYAEAVGVDPYDVLDRYKKAVYKEEHPMTSKRDAQDSGSGFSLRMVLVVAILILSLVGYLTFTSLKKEPLNDTDTNLVSEDITDSLVTDQAPTVIQEELPALVDGLHLEVVCVEDTTLKISADGGIPEEYVLKPEDHLELKAKSLYNILIDNTCGVTLFLNNNPVTVPGKCGQTATIQLP
ncbi:MAG: helix-turn-helix domain-containing protein [Proteobacteria bacterium]|nr:helix-turn-helix domain-containing protein [Pseudomonadota bacterium]